MKSCLLNTVCMLLPCPCLQCCSLVGPNGKDSAEQVQCSVDKTNDLKSYDTVPLTTVSQCGKAIPLQAWTGPKGSRSLRLPDFKTIGT